MALTQQKTSSGCTPLLCPPLRQTSHGSLWAKINDGHDEEESNLPGVVTETSTDDTTSSWSKKRKVSRRETYHSDHRYAASDWFQIMRNIPRSTILRAIQGPVLAVMVWSFLVSLVYKLAVHKGWIRLASHMCFSSRPHSFLVSALGLLLVFRTNSAYQRFNEGRKIWECIHSESRNLSRLAILYERELGEARLKRIFRLLAAFPYLLRQHIHPKSDPDTTKKPFSLVLSGQRGVRRGGLSRIFRSHQQKHLTVEVTSTSKQHWVDQRELPPNLLPPKPLQRCLESSNSPLWVCDRLSQEVNQVQYTDNFTSRERLQFLGQIGKLSQSIGQCERIHQTAVPLNYARHSLRSLTLWLFTLPFALVEDMGLLTGVTAGLVSWLMFGIYQIGYTIEDPFQGSLRLSMLCDAIHRDVMHGTDQMKRRLSAFERDAQQTEVLEWNELEMESPLISAPEAPRNESSLDPPRP